MSQEKTLTKLIDSYTWYDKKNKAQEIFRRLQAGLGGQITTQEDGVDVNENTTLLNFTGGGVNLTDLGEGGVEINIESSGSSLQDLQSVLNQGGIASHNNDFGYTSNFNMDLENSEYYVGFTTPFGTSEIQSSGNLVALRTLNGSNGEHANVLLSNGLMTLTQRTTNNYNELSFRNNLTNNTRIYIPAPTADGSYNLPLTFTDGDIEVTSNSNGIVDLSALNLGGGNYIPLTGTEVGSPVTGDIELNNDINLVSGNSLFMLEGVRGETLIRNRDSTDKSTITMVGGSVQIEAISGLVSTRRFIFIQETEEGDNILLSDNDPNARGLTGKQDFTPNIQDLDFVQKKYVDDNFNNSTGLEAIDEGNGIGYRLSTVNPADYGNIGRASIDLNLIDPYGSSPANIGVAAEASFGAGIDNIITGGGYSSAIGAANEITSSSYVNTAIGSYNKILAGYGNTTIGVYNEANTDANGFSSLFGMNNRASGTAPAGAVGITLDVRARNQFAIGASNTIWGGGNNDADRPIFTVGNGTYSAPAGAWQAITRSDAFNVRYNGVVEAPGLSIAIIDAEPTGRSLVTREYLSKITPISTTPTTVISLTTSGGNLCNMGAANTNTTYTTTGTVLNAYAKVLINTSSEPTITGATKIKGATWVANTDMYMIVSYNGVRVEYYFLEI